MNMRLTDGNSGGFDRSSTAPRPVVLLPQPRHTNVQQRTYASVHTQGVHDMGICMLGFTHRDRSSRGMAEARVQVVPLGHLYLPLTAWFVTCTGGLIRYM